MIGRKMMEGTGDIQSMFCKRRDKGEDGRLMGFCWFLGILCMDDGGSLVRGCRLRFG